MFLSGSAMKKIIVEPDVFYFRVPAALLVTI
jgi:hypothetical protein